ncbi:MAG TPA: UDP-3-O-(3-hydroxymyristoyl)glucosamine N-acyltransferase [Streptosporangiaceae bacterium]|nr:UDP-3-O-(3-hydroxymyristoyl)glucosamine N-acyltransferase [Streptosporangiaceae bacterium]
MQLHALTLAEAAVIADATLEGDPGLLIWFGAALADATSADLSFFDSRQPAELLTRTKAGAVIVPRDLTDPPGTAPGTALLRAHGPQQAFMSVVRALWERRMHPAAGVAPTATVHPGAQVSPDASIGDGCVIGPGADIGPGVALHPLAVVGDLAVIGPQTVIGPGAVVAPGVRIGARCVVHAGAKVGFAYRPTSPGVPGVTKPASFGGVLIGDEVEIGPNAVIEEGENEPTRIADGVKIGGLAFVGHDCSIGENAELIAMVGLASEVRVGSEALLMGQVGVTGGVRIGDRAVVFGKSGVIGNIPDDGLYMGYPAWPRGEWLRAQAGLRHRSRSGRGDNGSRGGPC